MKIPAGKPIIDLVKVAYKSNQPILLEGSHGIGKSQLMEQAAKTLKINCKVIDLSIIENTDLTGMPQIIDGKLKYALPEFLPTTGKGLLVFEELNRSPRYLQAPTLQLLTARRLNEYILPKGWLPSACANPDSADYTTEELDAALASRFMKVEVVPDSIEWLKWAENNNIDERIRRYVAATPDIFEAYLSNPRAWAYASSILQTCEASKSSEETILAALSGVVGDALAVAFTSFASNNVIPLEPDVIFDQYKLPTIRNMVKGWRSSGRIDLVKATLHKMEVFLQSITNWNSIAIVDHKIENLKMFVADLPGDLRRRLQGFLNKRGFTIEEAA